MFRRKLFFQNRQAPAWVQRSLSSGSGCCIIFLLGGLVAFPMVWFATKVMISSYVNQAGKGGGE